MGIVTDMDVSKQSVTLKLLSQKGLSTSTNVSIRHLRFCAKSCFFSIVVFSFLNYRYGCKSFNSK